MPKINNLKIREFGLDILLETVINYLDGNLLKTFIIHYYLVDGEKNTEEFIPNLAEKHGFGEAMHACTPSHHLSAS